MTKMLQKLYVNCPKIINIFALLWEMKVGRFVDSVVFWSCAYAEFFPNSNMFCYFNTDM